MAYNKMASLLCEIKSNQVAMGVIAAASRSMNNGQLAILEGSGRVTSRATVNTDKDDLGYITHFTAELISHNTEVTADYEEPFGDLFSKANETAERYAEIAFNMDFYAITYDEAIGDIIDNFRDAEKYVDTVIGIFI